MAEATDDPGACTEREITEPVDECLPDGRLNPAAIGWSRRPLHRSNLRGWGRNKRWDYWCVTTDSHLFSMTYSSVDYLAVLTAWFLDFGTGRSVEKNVYVPFALGVSLPDRVGGGDMTFDRFGLRLAILEEAGGTRLQAGFTGHDDAKIDADILVLDAPRHESLSVVIPWSERRFQFTSKHNTRPAEGEVRVGSDTFAFDHDNQAYGCLDYGRGRWPYRTHWNWGSASGSSGGHVVGLQLGGKWTDGTGTTENALCIDGRLHKLSEDLSWEYSTRNFRLPWTITSPVSKRVALTFRPFYERTSAFNIAIAGTEVHQCFGHYSGEVITDQGDVIVIDRLLGWAEEARMKW